MSNMILQRIKREIIERFKRSGLDTPDLDARLLIMAATGLSRTELIAQNDLMLRDQEAETLSRFVNRRLSGEPIDHILGRRAFYGRAFKISKDVLSPRPETELLVDFTLKATPDRPDPYILDLGTGSGAIIISVLAELEKARGVGVDVSEKALIIARENAGAHNVAARCEFYHGSWFEPITDRYDGIVANPPYISDADMESLDPEVKDFDPDLSLRGGSDGLSSYRAIVQNAGSYLKPGGWIAFEIGYDQSESVMDLLVQSGFHDVDMTSDLAGHPRMVTATWPYSAKITGQV